MRTQRMKDGTIIVGEQCQCGHPGIVHADLVTIIKEDNSILLENHHGPCCVSGCGCNQFTWEQFITIEELQQTRDTKTND